jgi:ribonuclease BN (tRNA processing enzyme)
MRNLANKIEEFSKCDDFSGEISSAQQQNENWEISLEVEYLIAIGIHHHHDHFFGLHGSSK